MSFRYNRSRSGKVIVGLGGIQYPVFNHRVQPSGGGQIHGTPQNLREFILHSKKTETRNTARLKLNKNINVALLVKLWGQHRAKKSQFLYLVSLAKLVQSLVLMWAERKHSSSIADQKAFDRCYFPSEKEWQAALEHG